MRSLLRTGFCAEAAAVPPPPPLLAPVPLLQAEAEAAAAVELGLRPGPGVGDGEEEADDGGERGTARGAGGEQGAGARDATLSRLWSFMMPLGRGESS